MFATKLIVPAVLAAAGLAFGSQSAKADSFSIAVGGCRPPVATCPPVYTPPVCTTPVYTYPAPVVVYRPYYPAYYRSGWSSRDHDRRDHHHRYDHDRDYGRNHDGYRR